MLIDSHAHIDMPEFDNDRDEVVERALKAGISYIINIGSTLEASRKGVEIAQRYDPVYATVGIHPHDAAYANSKLYDELKILLDKEKVIAVGEIGLDYYRDYSPREVQQKVFRDQIGIARDINKPIIVHSRDAKEDTLRILKEEKGSGLRGILHCFSGDEKMAWECIDLGFYISFAGPVTYTNASRLREVVKAIPPERLLIETDCPYLSPHPMRGKRNEPMNVRYVAEKIGELKRLSLEDIARVTSLNIFRLFGFDNNIEKEGKIAYKIRDSLYLNITNQCTNECTFCVRFYSDYVQGHNLMLDHEPTIEELITYIGDPTEYDEVVFCGYGEPTLRLDVIKEVAKRIKERGGKVRLNTNGHGNLIHGKNILQELQGLIDSISVSLNTDSSDKYNRICRPRFKNGAYDAVKEFILESKKYIPDVTITIINSPDLADAKECERIATEELGVKFRERSYNVVG